MCYPLSPRARNSRNEGSGAKNRLPQRRASREQESRVGVPLFPGAPRFCFSSPPFEKTHPARDDSIRHPQVACFTPPPPMDALIRECSCFTLSLRRRPGSAERMRAAHCGASGLFGGSSYIPVFSMGPNDTNDSPESTARQTARAPARPPRPLTGHHGREQLDDADGQEDGAKDGPGQHIAEQ